jgi:hypothetical protein
MLLGAECVGSCTSVGKGLSRFRLALRGTSTVGIRRSRGVELVGALSMPGRHPAPGRAALPEQSCCRSTWPAPGLGRALRAVWALTGRGQPQGSRGAFGGPVSAIAAGLRIALAMSPGFPQPQTG